MPTKNPKTRTWILRLSVVLLIIAVILTLTGLWPYKRALLLEAKSWQSLNQHIEPYMTIETPSGDGPFPVVIVIPGCEGVVAERATPRIDWLIQQGYMAVMVDSHGGRGLNEQDVCSGSALWGSERAGDIYAALDIVSRLPKADRNNTALLGYSHGGWAILDALSYDGSPSYALKTVPDNILASVKAAAVYYPYCDFPVRARYRYNNTTPLLMINASEDTSVNPQSCHQLATSWQTRGLPVTLMTVNGAAHGFDVYTHKNFNAEHHQQTLDKLSLFLRDAFNSK